ncbi:amyloid beta A4 precursor protein-binding family B member 1-interacting protein-like [Pongo abelii]|uniref:amyloid beta A4 precursor protein-binding family B member 1-interacting protein-like n=1 Tax=Pongo abelii TaxID=9601 RepID=UPI0004F3F349|nr:amyloid beta A4 precursor protein-binding family B member 1-interacting protein-like [Pongo abelii]
MAPPSPMDRCPRLQILSVLFSRRPRHMLKHTSIRSQPSETTRSQEHPGPAGPKVQPAPPPLVQRSWDTICSPATPFKVKGTGGWGFPTRPDDFLMPQQPPQPPPRSLDYLELLLPPPTSWRPPRTSCPLPLRSPRGLLCPTPTRGTKHQCSEAANE